MANGDGDKLHLAPNRSECCDEWGVLDGLHLKALVASKVPTEEHLVDNEVAGFSVESRRVRCRGVWNSSGVDEVRSCAVSRREEGVLGLEGEDPFRDVGRCLRAFPVALCVGMCISQVLRDICLSSMPCVGVWREWLEPFRRGGMVSSQ